LALGDTFLTDTPTQAPRSLERKAALRWLRAIQDHPAPRDRVLALLPFYAGLRIAEAVGLDVDDVHLSARKGVQPRYGQKPPSADHGVSFCCSDEVLALVIKAAVEAEHREAVPT
jgi:integrase